MYLANKLFSLAVDGYSNYRQNDKTCQIIRNPDTFNGQIYTIDDFYESYKHYFEKPWEFYIDNKEMDINMRKGTPKKTDRSYKSVRPYQPYLFNTPLPSAWPENNVVPFKWFSDEKKRSKTILLFAPGGWRPNYKVEEKFCYHLFQNGIDAGLLTVPYQIERTPKIANYSGEFFISAHVFFTIENFQLFVAEIRRLIQYMRKHYEYVGLIGMSSGGFYTGIAADCEEVDFLFPFITGCELGSITFNGQITKFVKRDLLNKGIDEDALNKAWSISDQLILGKHLKAKHIKHYISLFDNTVPTKFQKMLWEEYGKKDKLELESGHYSSYFMFKRIIDDITGFVKDRIK